MLTNDNKEMQKGTKGTVKITTHINHIIKTTCLLLCECY